MRQVDLLEPVSLNDRLPMLELYLGQVCSLTGISKMQLDYWTNKADIPTKGRKQRVYDMEAVELVMLIKQAKDKGLNLGAAIAAAREFQAREVDRLAGSRPDPCPQGNAVARELIGGDHRVDHVDPDACAELDSGGHGQPGQHLDVPVKRGVRRAGRRAAPRSTPAGHRGLRPAAWPGRRSPPPAARGR